MYGVLGPEGKSKRALVIIDKQGLIRYLDVHTTAGPPDNDILLQVVMDVDNATVKGQSV
jgi:alkyl hydroperoxide reductase subunit AhpC